MIRNLILSLLGCATFLSTAASCDAQIIFYRSRSRPTTVVPYLYRFPGYAYGGFGPAGLGYGYGYSYGFAPYSAVGPTVRYYSPAQIGIVHSGDAAGLIRMRSDPYAGLVTGASGRLGTGAVATGVALPVIPHCGAYGPSIVPIARAEVVPDVNTPVVAVPRMRRERYVAPVVGDTRAVVEIRVPRPEAGVWVEGQYIEGFGRLRRYTTPPLARDGRYTYRVRVAWNDQGKIRSETRDVVVQAGAVATVSFANSDQQ